MPQLIESRRRQGGSDIDLTPLVDVVFLLLIFFLVTSQFTQPTAAMKLPPGSPGAKPDEAAIRVELTADGDLFVNGYGVTDASFENALERAMSGAGSRKVRFYGDQRIDYGRFVNLLDRARLLGIDDFAIIKTQESLNESAPDR